MITSIGYINTGDARQINFAINVLTEYTHRESVLNYQLYNDDQHVLLLLQHEKINRYTYEIMYLKQYKQTA